MEQWTLYPQWTDADTDDEVDLLAVPSWPCLCSSSFKKVDEEEEEKRHYTMVLIYQAYKHKYKPQNLCKIQKTCVSGLFQRTNDRLLINLTTEDDRNLNSTPLFINTLACLTSTFYNMQLCSTSKEEKHLWAGNWFKKERRRKEQNWVVWEPEKWERESETGRLEGNHFCSQQCWCGPPITSWCKHI